jgi:hypothetical protein
MNNPYIFNSFLEVVFIALIISLICVSLATILNPDYTILGSMISKRFEKFFYRS